MMAGMNGSGMKRTVIGLGLLAGALAHGQLVFERTEIHSEAGLFDEQAVAHFRFENKGAQPVTITRLQSSCGCTVPQLDKRVYEPGEGGEITAIFTFGGRKGPQEKRIMVETEHRGVQRHSLVFKTLIPEWGRMQPQLLRWPLGAAAAPQEVRITIDDPQAVSVSGPQGELRQFDLALVRSAPGEVVYSVTPKSTETRVTERVVFILTARDGDTVRTQPHALYCLVR